MYMQEGMLRKTDRGISAGGVVEEEDVESSACPSKGRNENHINEYNSFKTSDGE